MGRLRNIWEKQRNNLKNVSRTCWRRKVMNAEKTKRKLKTDAEWKPKSSIKDMKKNSLRKGQCMRNSAKKTKLNSKNDSEMKRLNTKNNAGKTKRKTRKNAGKTRQKVRSRERRAMSEEQRTKSNTEKTKLK